MHSDTTLLFWWLHILNKRRYDLLLAQCGTLDAARERLSPEVLRGIGMRDETIRTTLLRVRQFDAYAEWEKLEKAGVRLTSLEDGDFPRLLQESSDPPVFLSYRGDLSVLRHPCVAVVGTREMSPYGKRVTEWLVPPLVRAGCTTVSGLAHGIDGVVARTTMDHGGRTAAVFGNGLGMLYPKEHVRLAEKIVESGGVLVSEYPYMEPPQQHWFPARNRIVASVSLATVVVEAPAESGSLITARLALEENRDVFACPGLLFDPTMEGNHRLIGQGQAQLLRSPDDILHSIGVITPPFPAQRAFTFATEDEATLHALLTTLPTTMDELVHKTGKSAGEIGSVLTLLELGGAVAKTGSGWVRS